MNVLEEYLLKKIEGYTIVLLVQGYMQTGKSTLVNFLMNNLSRHKFGCDWDFKKYCARNLKEFIDMIDKYNDKLLVYEEASKDISIDKWYDNLNHFFNIIMQTQAYKHNLIVLVFPHSASISKRQRYFINVGIEVVRKIDTPTLKATVFKPTIYRRRFMKLDDNDLYCLPFGNKFTMYCKYDKESMKKAKEYTNWLEETLKSDVIKDIKIKLEKEMRKQEIMNPSVSSGIIKPIIRKEPKKDYDINIKPVVIN